MSISNTLATSQQDFDLFAPSWQAGLSGSKCLTKSLKNYDIESVNIVKTCEKLCSALNENSKYHYDTSQCASKDEDIQCTVRKSNIPFRAFSNIWFGTLKIYQQQVNTLFCLSRDLFSRSCVYNVKHLKSSKRKSSLTSQNQVKKRRLTLSESNEKTYLTTNYSELLDDLERLTQEPLQKSLAESISGTITQYQVREITIREISATTYNVSDAVDEDSGFGEATHEEIEEFLNFVGDNSMFNNKRTSTKRKSSCGQVSPIKRSYCVNDTSVKPLESTPLTNNIFKRSITPTHITNIFDKNKIMENTINLSQNFIDNDIIETDKIKKEDISDVETKQTAKILGAKKKNNLIIDECTKIEMSEIIDDIKSSKLLTKVPRRNILKSYKRNKTALELLTRFNRKSFKLSLSLKQKMYISREQFERDYLNLLREIFKINYNEKWASEIYPKWIYFEDELQKQNKKQSVIKSRQQKKYSLQPKVNIKNEVSDTNEMDVNYFNEYQEIPTTIHYSNMETLNTCVHNEWRPYSVMVKLLNLWRFNQTNKIAAITLFKLAENQINRALGFNSLLNLFKKRFVNLTTFPESIELENISMGKAIKSNINIFGNVENCYN